jgi:hypothetical protein
MSGAGRSIAAAGAPVVPETRADRRWRTARQLTLILTCVLCLALCGQAVLLVLRYRDVFPIWDMMVVDYHYFTGPAKDFWVLRDNDHLPIFVMPLFWLDLRLFKGQGTFLVCGTLLLAVGIAGPPAAAILRDRGITRLLRFAAAVLLAAMFLWLGNELNLKWPKQIHMYLALFGVVMAIRIVAAMRPGSARGALMAAAWLFVATFSFGYGIIGFPVTIALCLARRVGWREAAILAGGLLVSLGLYLGIEAGLVLGEPIPRVHGGILPLYVVSFIAGPVVNLLRVLVPDGLAFDVAWALTIPALAVYAWQALRCFARPPSLLGAWALALACFTVCNGMETSIGRSFFGYAQAADVRYLIGQMPFWAGLVLLAYGAAARGGVRGQTLCAVGFACAGAALLISQQPYAGIMRDEAAWRMDLAVAALDHTVEPGLFQGAQPVFPAQIPVVVDGLRARGWGPFAWKQAHWIGRPLAAFGTESTACTGAFDAIAKVQAGEGRPPSWHATGWAVAADGGAGPDWILLVDQGGTVRGLAHTGRDRVDVAAAQRRPDAAFSGWTGYVPGAPMVTSMTAYALVGKHPCRLGPVRPAA